MRNLLFLSFFPALLGAVPAVAASLDDLQWQYRPLVVFAPTDDRATAARDVLAGTAGIDARDIAWFVVAPGGVQSNADHGIGRGALAFLHTGDGFEAVLIGKDGGVKARQKDALDLPALFARIDAMPMRRNEMKAAP